jgi:hypothetical protein
MKKVLAIIAVAGAMTFGAGAQNLGSILGGLAGAVSGDNGSTLTNILTNIAGTVYSAPVSLNGNYVYNGIAVGVTSSEGGILTNLAGTAVTSGIESKIDERLAKIGIKPGSAKFVFNAADETFTMTILNIPLSGNYKVHDGENTVTLTFGKTLKYLSMTGTLKSTLTGAEMLFPAGKLLTVLKKVASMAGQMSSTLGTIAKLGDGYDDMKLGFKLLKQ